MFRSVLLQDLSSRFSTTSVCSLSSLRKLVPSSFRCLSFIVTRISTLIYSIPSPHIKSNSFVVLVRIYIILQTTPSSSLYTTVTDPPTRSSDRFYNNRLFSPSRILWYDFLNLKYPLPLRKDVSLLLKTR